MKVLSTNDLAVVTGGGLIKDCRDVMIGLAAGGYALQTLKEFAVSYQETQNLVEMGATAELLNPYYIAVGTVALLGMGAAVNKAVSYCKTP